MLATAVRQGKVVKLSLKSSDASGGVNLVISDESGIDISLKAYDRLILDSMEANLSGTLTLDITDPGTGVSSDATLLLSFSPTSTGWATGGEGMTVSLGSIPLCTASASGSVELSGTGRMIVGSTKGPRAGYKQLLTPGGSNVF